MIKNKHAIVLSFCFFLMAFAPWQAWGQVITNATGRNATAATIDPNGDIWTLEFTGTTYGVAQYDASNSYTRTLRVSSGLVFTSGDRPSDIESATNGDIFYIDAYTAGGTSVYMLDASNSYAQSTLLSNVYPFALGIDANNNLYVIQVNGTPAASGSAKLVMYTAASGYTSSTDLRTDLSYNGSGDYPRGLGVDPNGDVYYLDRVGANSAYKLDASNSYSRSSVGSVSFPTGLAVDGNGDVYITSFSSSFEVLKYTGGTGTPSTIASGLSFSGTDYPWGLGSNLSFGDVVYLDPFNGSSGTVTLVDGTDPVGGTTLSPGDIAVIGMNIDNGNDQFSIVSLVDIPANTQIYFSDKRWDGSALQNVGSTGNFLEGTFVWTPSTNVSAGDIYNFSAAPATSTWSVSPSNGTVTNVGSNNWTSTLATGSPYNDASGDNIFIFTGSEAAPNFIYGFLNSASPASLVGTPQPSDHYWHNSTLPGVQISMLPSALTNALADGSNVATALAFTGSLHNDNLVYTGTVTGTRDALLTAIGDKSNWMKRDDIAYDLSVGGTNFTGTNPVFTIGAGCAAPTATATSIVFGTPTTTTIPLNSFTAPAGGATGYVIKINSTNSFTAPSNSGSLPSADLSWNNSGEQVVYAGTSATPNITITGLTSGTYYFKVFAYNDCSGTNTFESTGVVASSPTLPTVTLGISPTSAAENAGSTVTITATLSNTYTSNTTVNLSYSGTATGGGVDYGSAGTSIVINAGSLSNTTTFTVQDDALYEGNETVVVDISGVTNGSESGMQQVTHTINENDLVPNVSFELQSFYNPTSENGGVAYISAELDAATGVTVTVPVTFSGTATQGTDYSVSSTNIIIAAGDTKDSIAITGLNDMLEEGNETIIIDMGTPTNGVEDGIQKVTLTLSDDDVVAPTITSISRQTPSTSPTNANSLVFRVVFSESVSNVDVTDFDPTGTTANATNVSGSGTTYDVTVSGGDLTSFNGTVSLGFVGGQNIIDAVGTALVNTTPTGTNQNYVVDNAAPLFENTTPNITGITTTGFTLNIDMNEAGKAYFVVVANGAATPNATNVKNGQGNGGSTPVNANNSTINTGGFTDNLLGSGLSAGTDYDVYVVLEDDLGNLQASPTKLDMTTLNAEPTTPASSITFSSVTTTSMIVGWTNGNGANRLVIARATSAVNQTPSDATGYTANAVFGSGSDLGSSNFVVYSGTGNSVTVTGLTAGTTYHFTVIEFNGSGTGSNYRLTGAPVGNRSTLESEPTTPANTITFSSVATTGMTVNWTSGNGNNRLVIAREGSAVNQTPTDGTAYTANAAFGSGSDLGSSNYVVYSGTGNSVSLTGLTVGTVYHFTVIEFNGSGVTSNYRLTGAPTGNRSTLVAEPTTPASSITFSSLATTSMTVNWTSGNGTRRVVVARASSAVNQDPADGTVYTANAVFGSGSDLGSSNFVVYDGTGNSVSLTGLTAGTTYHFKVIEYNGTSTTSNYRLTGAPVANQATPVAEPTTAANTITFSSVGTTSMTVNWTSGNGTNRLVIARASSAVNQSPSDGTGYTANAVFGSGADLGSNNYVVYGGTGNSVTVTGLTAGTVYHFTVIEFNGSGATANYFLTSAPIGNRSTLAAEPTVAPNALTCLAVAPTTMTLVQWGLSS